MGDGIISSVAKRITVVLGDQTHREVNSLRGLKKFIVLFDEVKLEGLLYDDKWLKKLEDAAYKVDEILDEWIYALLRHKSRKAKLSLIPTSCLWFDKASIRRDTAMKVQQVEAKLDEILKEIDYFSFVRSSQPPRVQSTSFIDIGKVVDNPYMDLNRNDIVRKLCLSIDTDNQIVAIVGKEGIGKTTLAQLVYNDIRVNGYFTTLDQLVHNDIRVNGCCFELMIWLCVSHPFDVIEIARGIVYSIGKEIVHPNDDQLELVLQILKDSISGKKFLLVLDDVWAVKDYEWELLQITLGYGAPTSKILVTTRNEGLAKMMGILDSDIYRPRQLSDEEC